MENNYFYNPTLFFKLVHADYFSIEEKTLLEW